MKPEQLRDLIKSLAYDIEFCYNGMGGAICPINAKCIEIGYGDFFETYTDIDAAMTAKIFNGKSLEQVCEKMEFG